MSDDLIARLRDMSIQCCNLAADRIAALEAQVAALTKGRDDESEDAQKAIASYRGVVDDTPALLSLLYDADLLPEQIISIRGAISLGAVVEAYKMGAAALSSTPVAASPAPDPDANALGAGWMRREAAVAIGANTVRAHKIALRLVDEVDPLQGYISLEDAMLALQSIPGPTPADLLAEALRLPEVKRLVETFRRVLEISDRNHVAWNDAWAALAALPKGGA